MDHETAGERAMRAERLWSLAKQTGDEVTQRQALADYREAMRELRAAPVHPAVRALALDNIVGELPSRSRQAKPAHLHRGGLPGRVRLGYGRRLRPPC